MGFLSKVGDFLKNNVLKPITNFAKSGLGQTIIGAAATIFAGPVGGAIAKAGLNLLNGGKLNFQSLVQTGLSLFGPLTDKFGLSSLVKNLPAALNNPTGLLKGIGDIFNGNSSLGQIVTGLLGSTGLGQKVTDIANKVTGFLGNVVGIGQKAGGFIEQAGGLLSQFGLNTNFIGDIGQRLNSVINAVDTVRNIINEVTGALNMMNSPTALRA